MKLKDYLLKNKITLTAFALKLGIARNSLHFYITKRRKIPRYVKLAIEYVSTGEVKREDWDD